MQLSKFLVSLITHNASSEGFLGCQRWHIHRILPQQPVVAASELRRCILLTTCDLRAEPAVQALKPHHRKADTVVLYISFSV